MSVWFISTKLVQFTTLELLAVVTLAKDSGLNVSMDVFPLSRTSSAYRTDDKNELNLNSLLVWLEVLVVKYACMVGK